NENSEPRKIQYVLKLGSSGCDSSYLTDKFDEFAIPTSTSQLSELSEIDGQKFEHDIVKLLSQNGIQSNSVCCIQGDNGIDIIATLDKQLILIECKNRKKPIGINIIKKFQSSISRFEEGTLNMKVDRVSREHLMDELTINDIERETVWCINDQNYYNYNNESSNDKTLKDIIKSIKSPCGGIPNDKIFRIDSTSFLPEFAELPTEEEALQQALAFQTINNEQVHEVIIID
ncbi:5711_t:CDS:2, partial [Gigaspora rosea]